MSADACSRRRFLACAQGAVAVALAGAPVSLDTRLAVGGEVQGRKVGPEITYPIPPADGVTIDRPHAVILVRSAGRAYAFALSCPHQQAAVKWVAAMNRFQCSKHDSRYQPDGVYTSGRATRHLDRFPIRRDGDALVIDASRVFQSDKDTAGWAAAFVTL